MHTKRRRNFIALFCLISLFGVNACLIFSTSAPTPVQTISINTQVAQTIVAEFTLSSGYTAVARLTQFASTPTAIPPTSIPPTATSPSPTFTFVPPSATPFPTPYIPFPPPPPTYVPFPPVPPPSPCDWAQYVKDVTVPDGTVFSPDTEFTKVWRIRNIGSCTWTPYYSLVFTGGDRMLASNYIHLPEIVYPGESVDLAVDLVAPDNLGRFRGYWMLSNPYGQTFGIGDSAQKPFWVDIQVELSGMTQYDFAHNMCQAAWRNSGQSLPCPGNEHDSRGSVILLENPILETGYHENQPALWMRPQQTHNGWIKGVYPNYLVRPGDRFMADIGCLIDSPGCDVTFYLEYQISGQGIEKLGSWHEVYNGKLTRLVVDLSSLAGNSVQFILSVNNKGKPYEANTFWLAPTIQTAPPIPMSGW